MRGLAAKLGVSKPAITRALDRLSEFDLVRRKTDPLDRRSVLVQRTATGMAFMRELRTILRDAASTMRITAEPASRGASVPAARHARRRTDAAPRMAVSSALPPLGTSSDARPDPTRALVVGPARAGQGRAIRRTGTRARRAAGGRGGSCRQCRQCGGGDLSRAARPELGRVLLLARGELVLGPFQGRPACVRIALGKGVCGTAAAERRSILVPDVEAFPGHIACDTASRSELVVPLLIGDRLLGVSISTARCSRGSTRGIVRGARCWRG